MSITINGVTKTMDYFYDAMDKEQTANVPETDGKFIKITSDGRGNYVLDKLIHDPPKPDGDFYGVNNTVWDYIDVNIIGGEKQGEAEKPKTLQDLISKVKEAALVAKDEHLDDNVILASFFYSGVRAVGQGGGNLTRRKANKRKAIRRKATKRKAIRRKSMKRKSMKRKSMKRKNFKRKATRRKNSKRKNTSIREYKECLSEN